MLNLANSVPARMLPFFKELVDNKVMPELVKEFFRGSPVGWDWKKFRRSPKATNQHCRPSQSPSIRSMATLSASPGKRS
jgi:hypothetical protein